MGKKGGGERREGDCLIPLCKCHVALCKPSPQSAHIELSGAFTPVCIFPSFSFMQRGVFQRQ